MKLKAPAWASGWTAIVLSGAALVSVEQRPYHVEERSGFQAQLLSCSSIHPTAIAMLYTAIGWIIIVGFAATLTITLLGLIGKVTIKDGYMKPLFTAMILEIISAGFFLFYQGSEPRLDPSAAYAFDTLGDPVTVFVKQGGKKVDSLKTPTSERIKENRRQLEEDEESDRVYIYGKVGDDTVYFGNLDRKSLTDIIGVGDMDPLHRFYSGMYLSQPPDKRRGPRRAVEELILFLKEQEQYEVQQDSSIKQLYHLITYIRSDEDFKFLIDKIKEVRTGFNRDKELCEVYLQYVNSLRDSLTGEEQERKRLTALKHAMLYLGSEAHSKERTIVERVKELMNIYLSKNAFVITNNKEIRTAIENLDSTSSKKTLLALAEELEV